MPCDINVTQRNTNQTIHMTIDDDSDIASHWQIQIWPSAAFYTYFAGNTIRKFYNPRANMAEASSPQAHGLRPSF